MIQMTSSLTEYGFTTIAVKRELRDRLSKRLRKLNKKDRNPASKTRMTMTGYINYLMQEVDKMEVKGE